MKLVGIFILFLDVILQNLFRGQNIGVANGGVSFGWGSNSWGSLLSLAVYIVFVTWFLTDYLQNKRISIFLFLMALGGLGNLLNRLIWGNVWDYISLSVLPFSFNLSDLLISLGVVSYILGVNGDRRTIRRQRNTGN